MPVKRTKNRSILTATTDWDSNNDRGHDDHSGGGIFIDRYGQSKWLREFDDPVADNEKDRSSPSASHRSEPPWNKYFVLVQSTG